LGLLGLDESEHLVETSVEVVFELRTPADLARALDKGAITLTIEAVREYPLTRWQSLNSPAPATQDSSTPC